MWGLQSVNPGVGVENSLLRGQKWAEGSAQRLHLLSPFPRLIKEAIVATTHASLGHSRGFRLHAEQGVTF